MTHVEFEGVSKIYPDGTRAVDALDLGIEDGEFMVLVGPSGCGKSTALRMAAGLEEISEGRLMIGGNEANAIDARQRDIAMVFQNYALYPHMSIFDNIAFPLVSRRVSKSQIREDVGKIAAILGLDEMLSRRPGTLSGGQRQRVAMARALVRTPQVFLMDEPLSNLDAKLRVQMRAEITNLQKRVGVTTIYVTHDQVEAMTMGNRIAVMRKGVLQQVGPPQELYDRPRNLFTATFIGSPAMNLFRARIVQDGDGIACVVGEQRLALGGRSTPAGLADYVDRDVALGIRPENLNDVPAADIESVPLTGEVRLVEALGSERLVHLDVVADRVLTEDVLEIARDTDAAVAQTMQEGGERTVPTVAKLDPKSTAAPGERITLHADIEGLRFFDLDTGEAVNGVAAPGVVTTPTGTSTLTQEG